MRMVVKFLIDGRIVQTEIRAKVAPVPYSEVARDIYAEGWRSKQVA